MKRNAATRFLIAMFGARSSAPVFITSLANDRSATRRIPPRQIVTRDIERVEAFAAKWDQPERALYFCVATLKPGILRRAKENLAELICLHADLDLKNIEGTRREVEAALKRLPLPPQLVVFSGHGLHAYWLLDKALPANEENIARVERLLKLLADVVAGDPAVCECSRVMRLPGSHNSKNGEWVLVKMVSERTGSYSLAQLETWLKIAKPVLQRRLSEKKRPDNPWLAYGEEHTFRAPVDVEERLEEMQYQGPGETSIHNTQLSVTAALLTRGFQIDDVVFRVLRATVVAAGPEGRGWDWFEEERGLRAMCRSWLNKHPPVFFNED
jgi:hypothetical protein